MRRVNIYAVLLSLVFVLFYNVSSYAADWEVYQDSETEDQRIYAPLNVGHYITPSEVDDVTDDATASNASASDADFYDMGDVDNGPGIELYGSYTPYDASISTSVVQYMSDVLPKLGNVHYVLFRSGQYSYRLVYGDALQLSSSTFSASDADYVAYDTRDYTWTTGKEGAFTLRASSVMVYSDLGAYPALASDSIYVQVIAFAFVMYFIFCICRSMFTVRHLSI